MPRETEAICGECKKANNIFYRLSDSGTGNGSLGKATTEVLFKVAFKHYVFKKEGDDSQPCDYVISTVNKYMGGETTQKMVGECSSIEKNSYCKNGKCLIVDKIIKEDQVFRDDSQASWFERIDNEY